MTEKREKWFRILKLPFLIIFYTLFLLLGAYIITTVEADFDEDIRNKRRLNLVEVLDKYNLSYTDPKIEEILITAQKALDVDAVKLKRLDKNLSTRWRFSSSLYFTATLVTTVGYGDRYPLSTGGQRFCIMYAIIGIPFTGILISVLCQCAVLIIKKTEPFLEKWKKSKDRKQVGQKSDLNTVQENKESKKRSMQIFVRSIQSFMALFVFVVLLWLLPALVMMSTQKWNFLTAIYFCFITISTIGLGDVTPEMSLDPLNLEENKDTLKITGKQILIIMYIIVSLTGLTVIITLFTSIWKQKKKKAKAKKNAQKAEAEKEDIVIENIKNQSAVDKS